MKITIDYIWDENISKDGEQSVYVLEWMVYGWYLQMKNFIDYERV